MQRRCSDGFGAALLRIFSVLMRLSSLSSVLMSFVLLGCTRNDPPRAEPVTPPKLSAARPSASAKSAPAPSPKSTNAAQSQTDSVPPRYAFDRVHSALTPSIVQGLRKIAARDAALRPDVFAKVGDSITFSDDSYRCLAKPNRNLAEHSALAPVIARFAGKPAYGTNPYSRDSLTAQIGWSAWQVLSGDPPPLAKELKAIQPRIALVQFGTNDIEIGAIYHFADQLWNIVDYLVERGVVPVLFTIPPRKDKASAAVWAPRYNTVIRGVAQARRVPLVDYHLALRALPGGGMARDGIHPTTFHGARGRDACDFSKDGLRHGYNLRNLLAVQALERVDAALRTGTAPDTAGRAAAPDTSTLPLVDVARLAGGGGDQDGYSCAGAESAPGKEAIYAFELAEPSHVHIMAFDRGAQVQLYLLRDPKPSSCQRTHARVIKTRLAAGRHYLVLDRQQEKAPASESIVVITKEE